VTGTDHVEPLSSECERNMSVVPAPFRSIQEQYMRPLCGPPDRSTSSDGYTRARRKNSAGIPISNGITFVAMVRCVSHVFPPSSERLKAITLALKSFQETYNPPFGPTAGDAPMDRPGPEGSSARVIVKVAP